MEGWEVAAEEMPDFYEDCVRFTFICDCDDTLDDFTDVCMNTFETCRFSDCFYDYGNTQQLAAKKLRFLRLVIG